MTKMSPDHNYVKTEGYRVVGTQPQVMNILSFPAPKRLWPRLLWSRIKRLK
jgi:hypothetical protein